MNNIVSLSQHRAKKDLAKQWLDLTEQALMQHGIGLSEAERSRLLMSIQHLEQDAMIALLRSFGQCQIEQAYGIDTNFKLLL
ncbi:hypothetical protein WH50_06490 [Pokkaliibacter plantistimulans]|uniref:Uncharacterized protein n=1 Tax=Pokkaliibacter plantistimulans TaxID=1635171 RepID=A0ABX5M3H1_9GAMM|nr:hypothetical protein [Pokkaliibacter plantistimulans]PXF32098.1 hypothetical protein WH50_06490 [Pokkaliibacter plantistimulans]